MQIQCIRNKSSHAACVLGKIQKDVMVGVDCHVERIWNHLEDKPQGKATKDYVNQVSWGGRSHTEIGNIIPWHGAWTHKKEEVSQHQGSSSSTSWRQGPSGCCWFDFPPWWIIYRNRRHGVQGASRTLFDWAKSAWSTAYACPFSDEKGTHSLSNRPRLLLGREVSTWHPGNKYSCCL